MNANIKIKNSDNDYSVSDSGSTPIYLLRTAHRPMTVLTSGGSTLTNPHEWDILLKSNIVDVLIVLHF